MSAPKVVTLKNIAEKAGVSLMTVSRALRQQGNVSPETQARIRQIADELGYRPHPLVSALMSYRRAAKPAQSHSSLAFITSFRTRDGWRNRKIYQEFFQGAAEAADRHGYRLEEFWLREPGMSAQRLSRILFNRNISGVIIAPLPVSQGHLRLDWEKFSAVTFSYTLARPLLHRVANHQFRSMRLAMRQLRRLGYQRIGLAMPASLDARIGHQWMGAFLMEQRRSPAKDHVAPCLLEDRHWNEANFREWFLRHKPDVIVTQQVKILDWLDNLGKKVPGQIGFAHLNCPDASGRYAGIYQNSVVIGRVGVDFLVSMIQRNERGVPALAHTLLVEGSWVDGATAKKSAGAA
jgi:DNA-binding LacI/PurR family transcriptional regulator